MSLERLLWSGALAEQRRLHRAGPGSAWWLAAILAGGALGVVAVELARLVLR